MTTTSSSIKDIGINDVLSGRGGKINAYPGNIQFRKLVKLHKGMYMMVKKHEKGEVARLVVNTIKNMDPPGRFLKENVSSECWVEIPIARVLRKTKQALREPEDDDNHDAKGDTSIQSVSRIFADTSVGYPTATLGPKPTSSPMNKPNILQVAEARMCCSPPEALFNHHTHHQIEVKNTSATVCMTTSHQKFDSRNSNPSLKDSNIKNRIALTEIGNSLLSIDTASTSASFDSSINNRRNHFRKMKSEGSSLPSIMSEIDNSLNEDEIMNESLVSIEMDSLKSIDIRSIDMESYTMSLQDKASSIDLAHMVYDSDQCSMEDLLSDEQITGDISTFDSVIGVSRPVFPV